MDDWVGSGIGGEVTDRTYDPAPVRRPIWTLAPLPLLQVQPAIPDPHRGPARPLTSYCLDAISRSFDQYEPGSFSGVPLLLLRRIFRRLRADRGYDERAEEVVRRPDEATLWMFEALADPEGLDQHSLTVGLPMHEVLDHLAPDADPTRPENPFALLPRLYAQLQPVPRLELFTSLDLGGIYDLVDDSALVKLRWCAHLTTLLTPKSRITDEGVALMASALDLSASRAGSPNGIWRLRAWYLKGTKGVSDRAMKAMAKWPGLVMLGKSQLQATRTAEISLSPGSCIRPRTATPMASRALPTRGNCIPTLSFRVLPKQALTRLSSQADIADLRDTSCTSAAIHIFNRAGRLHFDRAHADFRPVTPGLEPLFHSGRSATDLADDLSLSIMPPRQPPPPDSPPHLGLHLQTSWEPMPFRWLPGGEPPPKIRSSDDRRNANMVYRTGGVGNVYTTQGAGLSYLKDEVREYRHNLPIALRIQAEEADLFGEESADDVWRVQAEVADRRSKTFYAPRGKPTKRKDRARARGVAGEESAAFSGDRSLMLVRLVCDNWQELRWAAAKQDDNNTLHSQAVQVKSGMRQDNVGDRLSFSVPISPAATGPAKRKSQPSPSPFRPRLIVKAASGQSPRSSPIDLATPAPRQAASSPLQTLISMASKSVERDPPGQPAPSPGLPVKRRFDGVATGEVRRSGMKMFSNRKL